MFPNVDVPLWEYFNSGIIICNKKHKDLNDEVDLKYFIEHTKDLDMLRKQNFALIFPEVYKVVQKELAKTNRTYETEKGRLQ